MFQGSPDCSVLFCSILVDSVVFWLMSSDVEVVRSVSCDTGRVRIVSKSNDMLRSCDMLSYCGGAVRPSSNISNTFPRENSECPIRRLLNCVWFIDAKSLGRVSVHVVSCSNPL